MKLAIVFIVLSFLYLADSLGTPYFTSQPTPVYQTRYNSYTPTPPSYNTYTPTPPSYNTYTPTPPSYNTYTPTPPSYNTYTPTPPGYNYNTPRECVNVPGSGDAYSYVSVATCERVSYVEAHAAALGQGVSDLQRETQTATQSLGQAVTDLQDRVGQLEGENAIIRTIEARLGDLRPDLPDEVRPFCEFYTAVEMEQFCRLVDVELPNKKEVYFRYLPCGDGPEFYIQCQKSWKIRDNCHKPNGPTSDFYDCFYDPLAFGETCTHFLFLSCDGYTENIFNYTAFREENPLPVATASVSSTVGPFIIGHP